MSQQRTPSGVWVVLVLLAAGVVAGVAGLIVRKFPEGRGMPPATKAVGREMR